MLTDDALRSEPTLPGRLVVLRPLGPEHADVFWSSLHDPEVRRLTGTHTEFRRDRIDAWLATRAEQTDRLDLAVHRRTDELYLGDLALTELDPANETVEVRIALASTEVAGQGYGTDAMNTILAEGRARQSLHWEGERHDALLTSVLRPEWEATRGGRG